MLWALSDLHLPGSTGKTMDRFGPGWAGHPARLSASWRELVAPEDTVLIPGDISWAMREEEAEDDLQFLASLPGRKVITRGNHDYWWKSLSQVRAVLPHGITAMLNEAADMGDFILAAARGWTLPSSPFFLPERDEPILTREIGRLKTAVADAGRFAEKGKPLIAMMHFAPTEDLSPSSFTGILSDGGVTACVFGHLHGDVSPLLGDFMLDGVRYIMCSADQTGFRPVPVPCPCVTEHRGGPE